MRIIQLLPTLSSGDAVGNEALAIDRAIRKKGIETAIYAENIDRRLPAGTAQPYDRFPKLSPEDIILYHASRILPPLLVIRGSALPGRL